MPIRLFKQRFVLRGWLTLLTLAAFLTLSKLAWWQWQRAAEKTQQMDQLAQWQTQQAPDWSALLQPNIKPLDGAPVAATVRWLSPYIWLVDNQIVAGRFGYDVVIAVKPVGADTALLVNLGWVAAPDSRQQLPEVQIPAEFQLNGVLRTELKPFLLGQNIEPMGAQLWRVQAILPAQIEPLLNQPLVGALFYQMQQSPYQPHYQPVVMPASKHRAYALQWLLLAVAVVMVSLFASYQKESA